MPWQLLTAISVVTLSISVLLQRVLLHKDKSDPIAYVIVFQGLVATLIAVYALLNGFELPDFGKLWWQMLLTIALYGLGHVIYAKTLQLVEASIFSILFATNAIWVMIMSFIIFNEQLNIVQFFGALLIFASVGLLAERKGEIKLDRGILLGLLTGLLFGLATTSWVYVGKYADSASWNALSFAGPSLIVLLANPRSISKIKPILRGDKLTRMLLLGVLFSVSAVTLLNAYQKGQASIIAPLQQTTIIATILLAIIFLNEKTRLWQKAFAAVICFAGVLLIV